MGFKSYLKLLESMSVQSAAEILGIPPGEKLTDETIKRFYHKAARKSHPDAGGSEEEMKKVNAAYEVLKANKGGTVSKKVDFDDIHNQYIDLCEEINEYIKKIFKPNVYEKYLNSVTGYNFKLKKEHYLGSEYCGSNRGKNYGHPYYAGLKAEFEDAKQKSAIKIEFSVDLTDLRKQSKGLAAPGDNSKYPLSVTSTGFIAGRQFKLFNSFWKSVKITDSKLNDPETFLPKTKLKKQLTKSTKTKATKKDFISLITSVLNGERMDTGDDYMIPVSGNVYLNLLRGTMMRKGYWRVSLYEKSGKYSYNLKETLAPTLWETPELLDLFMNFKGKTASGIKKLVNDYKKEHGG